MPSLAPAAAATGSTAAHAGCAALAAGTCAPPAHPTRSAAEGVIPGTRITRRLAIANTIAAHTGTIAAHTGVGTSSGAYPAAAGTSAAFAPVTGLPTR